MSVCTNVCACVYVCCVYKCVFVHVCMCVYLCVFLCQCMCVYTCVSLCTCVWMCVYMCVFVCVCVSSWMCDCMFEWMRMCVCLHVCIYVSLSRFKKMGNFVQKLVYHLSSVCSSALLIFTMHFVWNRYLRTFPRSMCMNHKITEKAILRKWHLNIDFRVKLMRLILHTICHTSTGGFCVS